MYNKNPHTRTCGLRTPGLKFGKKGAFIFIYFILFATLITKNIGKEEEEKKKEVARRPNRNYRSL